MNIVNKLNLLLTKDQRRAGIIQLVFLFISMILETLSVGLLIPALTLLSQGDIGTRFPSIRPLLNKLGNPSQEKMLICFMLLLVAVYFFKMIFLAIMAWKQSKFIYGLQSYFSQKLFSGYLNQPYSFHLQKNSAHLIRNSTSMVSQMTGGLMAFLTSLTEFFTFMGILGFLIYMEPFGTLIIIVFLGLSAGIFQRFTSKRLLRWGQDYQYHEGMRLQHLQQGLGGVKDVKLLGRENDFIDKFYIHNQGSARVSQRQQALQLLPRLWIEMLAVMGMAGLVMIMIYRGNSLELVMTTLGLFAAAAFRMIPSLNRIMAAAQGVRYAQPAIELLYDELTVIDKLDMMDKKVQPALSFSNSIFLDNIFFKYESSPVESLKGITLSIACGSTVGFVGTTGAGKSTLVDIMLGLLTPVSGKVLIDGLDIQSNLRSWQNKIGYVPQSIYLTDDTLRNNIAFGIPNDKIDETAILKALDSAQLSGFVKTLPEGLNTIVGERGIRLSGGQRQRIGIARALYHDPTVLVLDEATSSLDNATEKSVMEAIDNLHGYKTIIIIAHRLSTVEHCDHIFKLEFGKVIAEGASAKVLNSEFNF